MKFDFSALGLGVSIEGQPPITDIEHAISLMLEQIKKQGKRVLITVGEITNNEYVKVFTSAFQIFVRQDYPVFLLMTGLYDNIYELQNDKAQTFLYRAPKVILEPLNRIAMRNHYAKVFKISQGDADRMATLTKGYPFAFQVLGYLLWESKAYDNLDEILFEYDRYLSEYVYEKIWSELSGLDKTILKAMADSGDTKVKDIRSHVGIKPEEFSVYRERLRRKGIINTEQYGSLTFALPRFEEFIAAVH